MNLGEVERQIAVGARGAGVAGEAVRSAAGSVLRAMGGRPIGSPGVMREVAAAYRRHASHLRMLVGNLVGAVDHTDWTGPGADRAKRGFHQEATSATHIAERLEQLARDLDGAAQALEASQRSWDNRSRRLIAEAVNALKHAGHR